AELKVAADKDAFTTAELLERLSKSIFSELDGMKDGEYSTRKPAISSVRRNLQRYYVKRMGTLALGQLNGAPEDCQSIAYAELGGLADKIDLLLKGNVKLDAYSKAHLQETSARIRNLLDAKVSVTAP